MNMSRALGAAYLSHQVEQLEKTVNSTNWRDRKMPTGPASPPAVRRAQNTPNVKVAPKKKTGEVQIETRRKSPEVESKKDADIVVVDASVLVHALYKVKKWCKAGQEEVVIIPLEGA